MIANVVAPLPAFLTGFAIGGGLIMAIGAQNAFILRQGLIRQHVLPLVLFCAISDTILIIAGVAGLGTLIQSSPTAVRTVSIGGAMFLAWYGWQAFQRSKTPQSLEIVTADTPTLTRALALCAAFTWANPHVYLDTVALVGSLSAPFVGDARIAYTVGAATASFVWFFSLGYGARLLTPLFAKPAAWRALDLLIAAVMWLIAISLLWSVLKP